MQTMGFSIKKNGDALEEIRRIRSNPDESKEFDRFLRGAKCRKGWRTFLKQVGYALAGGKQSNTPSRVGNYPDSNQLFFF